MSVIIYSRIGESKGGRRIWMEGFHLRHGGIEPDTTLHIRKHATSNVFLLHPKPGSDSIGTVKVSRRTLKDGRVKPLIEIKDATILDSLPGLMKLRIGIFKGKITIRAHVDEKRIQDREKDFLETLMRGEPLKLGSLFHGGGLLDHALHSGLERVGISSYTKLAVEWDSRYIGSSYANNPHFFREDSILINGPIQDSILPDDLSLHVLSGGVPCVGSSRSGISKNKLSHPEEHKQAGAMFFYFLRYIEALNPAIICLENVVEYASSSSMSIIRSVLEQWGYTLRETVLNGNDLGSFENRDRLAMIATSKGLSAMNLFPEVRSIANKPATLADIVEDIPNDSEIWKDYDYLRAKAVRDKASGKGFSMQELTLDAEKVGTIGRGYFKVRSTEPRIIHPEIPNLTRLLTLVEHCRVKGAPESIIAGNSTTVGHEILGQGICVLAFEAIFVELGIEMLTQIGMTVGTMAANEDWFSADILYLSAEQQEMPQASAIDLSRYPNAIQFADNSIALIASYTEDLAKAA